MTMTPENPAVRDRNDAAGPADFAKRCNPGSTPRRTLAVVVRVSLMIVAALALPSRAEANYWHRNTSNFKDKADLQAAIDNMAANNVDWQEIVSTPSGEWAIIPGPAHAVVHSDDFPSDPLDRIDDLRAWGQEIQAVAFAPNGAWAVVGSSAFWYTGGIPNIGTFYNDVVQLWQNHGGVGDLAFSENGYVLTGVLLTLSRTRSSNMQTSAIEFVLRDEGRA